MTAFEIAAATERNRRRFADVVDELSPDDHDSETLCAGWTVRILTAHMLQPMTVGFLRFALTSLRHGARTDPTIDAIARRMARAEVPDLTDRLRELAGVQVSPTRVGPYGPFAETCIHLRDLARPLHLDADVPLSHWRHLLDYLTSPEVAPALVPPGRLDGISFSATDQQWSAPGGAEIVGSSETIAMAIAGRRAVLPELVGPGVGLLAERLRQA